MSNEITLSHHSPNLPAEVSTEIRLLSTSPAKYLENLPVEKMNEDRPPNAIMLSLMKHTLHRDNQLMILCLMIMEVNDFFNVRGNMNKRQIKLTAELILDNPGFYDLTLGNIKACFRHKMATVKLYDRLDGNLIIGWLREFKSEMAEMAYMSKSGQREAEDTASGMSYEAYLSSLKERAAKGDPEAIKRLKEQEEWMRKIKRTRPSEQTRKDKIEFMKRKLKYLKEKEEHAEREQGQHP